MAESKTEQMLDKVEKLYKKIMVLEAQTMKVMRTGSDEDVKKQLRRVKEECLGQQEGFALAMDWANIISTRFYVEKIDITEAMREKIYLEHADEESEGWQILREAIELNERKHFNDYMEYVADVRVGKGKAKVNLDHYLDLAKQVNEFYGEFEGEDLYLNNPKDFKELVKKLRDARKHCMLLVRFTKEYVSKECKELLSDKNLSYEDTYILANNVIKNLDNYVYINEEIVKGKKPKRGQKKSLKEEGVEPAEFIEDFYQEISEERAEIMEKFSTKFVEEAGIDRRLAYKYLNEPLYRPFKKLALVIGLYCEPYVNLGECEEETAIIYNLETFMNQNGLSIKSTFATITKNDNLLDIEVLRYLEDGYTHKMITHCLKRFATTKVEEDKDEEDECVLD